MQAWKILKGLQEGKSYAFCIDGTDFCLYLGEDKGVINIGSEFYNGVSSLSLNELIRLSDEIVEITE